MPHLSPNSYMHNTALLVDARNVLYRAVYASQVDNKYEIKYHCLVIFLRQFAGWLTKFNPDSLHVFWDAPRITVWRKKLLESYKNRSSSNYILNLAELLSVNTTVAMNLFKHLNVRQYERETMEADDLIYAAANVLHPKNTIIVSTDSDLTQIPFMISSSKVYDPHKMKIVDTPTHHPAYLKAIAGDKADCIKGYPGIGPKKGELLLENPSKLQQFLDINGRDVYHRNLLITDLSLNPKIHANKLYVQRILGTMVNYDKNRIRDLIKEHKLIGMDIEYADLVSPFLKLS